MRQLLRELWLLSALVGCALAQPPRTAMEGTLQAGMSGRWWANPQVSQRLSLTPAQQKKMDEIFQESRLKLIDLTAALDKEEVILEPLVDGDQPDAAKIRAQIDRIAQARGDLERANANMLLGIRLVLTPGQWKELRANGTGPRAKRLQQQQRDNNPSGAATTGPVPTAKKSN